MKNPYISTLDSRTAFAVGIILSCCLPSLAFGQFNKTTAGPWNYNDTANWTSGLINGNFTATPAVSLVTVTFAADTVLSTGLNFNFSASNLQRTYALTGSGADRTITLGGNLTVSGSSGPRTVTIGSTTSGQKLNIDLGGVTCTFTGASAGGTGHRGLDLLNTVSNGGIATDSTVSGPNQLTLAGNNTYAGGTTLTKGYILNINNGGNSSSNSAIGTGTLTMTSSGTGPSAIIDNTSGSAVTLQTNNVQAWDGDFVFADIGARTVAVTHSDLNLGTGAVTLGGATGSRSVTVNSNTLTVGGTISGGRGLSKAGAGTLVLTNTASTYTGITQVSAGTLEVSKFANAGLNSSLGAPVSTGGNTVINGTGTLRYVGSGDSTNRSLTLLSTPTLDASGSGALLLTSGSTAFGSANSAVTFTLAGTSTANNTYNGNLGNNGSGVVALTKTGTGKWVLSGNTTYSGATTVSNGQLVIATGASLHSASAVSVTGGELIVNGAVGGAVAVSLGAKLSGAGTISGGVSVANGGLLNPGNSLGNLIINNGLTLGGNYGWDLAALSTLNPGTDFDILTIVSGNVDLTGATLGLNLGVLAPSADPFWQTSQTWSGILNNTGLGTLTGAFAAIDNSIWSSLGTFSTTYTGNDVNLVWSAVPEPNAAILVGGLGVSALLRRRRV
jgi:fibronectin-binding autotransporter adhesin